MREYGTVIGAVIFMIFWVIGVLASLSVSIFILIGAFSVIQILFGVDQDNTLLYEILTGLGVDLDAEKD